MMIGQYEALSDQGGGNNTTRNESDSSTIPVDERCVVGTVVQTKAYHIFNVEECQRRYGIEDGKNQLITGTVVSARVSLSQNNRQSTSSSGGGYIPIFVTVDFQIPTTIVNWDNTSTTSIQVIREELSVRYLILNNQNKKNDISKGKKSSTGIKKRRRKHNNEEVEGNDDDDDEGEEEHVEENNNDDEYLPPSEINNDGGRDPLMTRRRSNVNDTLSPTIDVGKMNQWWYEDDEKLLSSVTTNNELLPQPSSSWSLKIPNIITGETSLILTSGCDMNHRYSRLDYFSFILPPHHITLMLRVTNENLIRNGKRLSLLTRGELMKFLGIIILITQYENPYNISNNNDANIITSSNDMEVNKKNFFDYLWSTIGISKYRTMPYLGRTGMTKERFELILQCIRFSDQPHLLSIPPNMNQIQYQWKMIDDYVNNRNQHRHEHFIPSNTLCITDTYTQYYHNNHDDNSGYWTTINDIIPIYYCKNKSESSSCEMNCCYDGSCGISITINIVKSLDESLDKYSDYTPSNNNDRPMYLPNGQTIIQDLIPTSLYNTNRTIVCDKSSANYVNANNAIRTSQVLKEEMGMDYIASVIKPQWSIHGDDDDEMYPFPYLATYEPMPIGNYKGLIFKDNNTDDEETGNKDTKANKQPLYAFVWKDQVRRFFVSTSPSLLGVGKSQKRYHNDIGWSVRKLYCHDNEDLSKDLQNQQQDEISNNNPHRDRNTMIIPQPKVVQMFHEACSIIESHTHSRNNVLNLEKKLSPLLNNDWYKRIVFSLFAIDIVDTWKLYQQCTMCHTSATQPETEQQFYMNLAEELIDNNYDDTRLLVSQQQLRNLQQASAAGTAITTPGGNNDSNPLSPLTHNNATIVSQRIPGCYYAHITTTSKKRKNRLGEVSNQTLQGRCRICNCKTIYVCSQCKDENPNGKEPWICYTKNGKVCFHQHMESIHNTNN